MGELVGYKANLKGDPGAYNPHGDLRSAWDYGGERGNAAGAIPKAQVALTNGGSRYSPSNAGPRRPLNRSQHASL